LSKLHAIVISMLLLCFAHLENAFAASTVIEQPPRAFGYVIGDVLKQRVLLEIDNHSIELIELPPEQREGAWFERVSSEITSDKRWLVLRYQIINAPTELTTATLPAIALPLTDGTSLDVDAWPITIAPLTPRVVAGTGELPAIQADRSPILPNTTSTVHRLRIASIGLVATLLCWLLWWLWRRTADQRRLPYAAAFHAMRKLDTQQLNNAPDAWFTLHHAFNGSAGRTINAGSVSELIQHVPWLEPLQPRIEAFYSASAERFFADKSTPTSFALLELSKDLYIAEKQHADGAPLLVQR